MNKLTSIILNCTLALAVSAPAYASTPIFQTGDLITQTSKSRQSRFIRAATGSPYTHIGMIVNKEGKQQVIEAVEPVKYTPLKEWIGRGVNGKYAVFRPTKSVSVDKVVSEAEKHLGKHYDSKFQPSDKKMYCSELIFKAYKRGASLALGVWQSAGKILGKKKDNPKFKKEIKKRWGKFPSKMKMITPVAMTQSPNVNPIYSNY